MSETVQSTEITLNKMNKLMKQLTWKQYLELKRGLKSFFYSNSFCTVLCNIRWEKGICAFLKFRIWNVVFSFVLFMLTQFPLNCIALTRLEGEVFNLLRKFTEGLYADWCSCLQITLLCERRFRHWTMSYHYKVQITVLLKIYVL